MVAPAPLIKLYKIYSGVETNAGRSWDFSLSGLLCNPLYSISHFFKECAIPKRRIVKQLSNVFDLNALQRSHRESRQGMCSGVVAYVAYRLLEQPSRTSVQVNLSQAFALYLRHDICPEQEVAPEDGVDPSKRFVSLESLRDELKDELKESKPLFLQFDHRKTGKSHVILIHRQANHYYFYDQNSGGKHIDLSDDGLLYLLQKVAKRYPWIYNSYLFYGSLNFEETKRTVQCLNLLKEDKVMEVAESTSLSATDLPVMVSPEHTSKSIERESACNCSTARKVAFLGVAVFVGAIIPALLGRFGVGVLNNSALGQNVLYGVAAIAALTTIIVSVKEYRDVKNDKN